MKTINFFTKTVLLFTILFATYSCEKNEDDAINAEAGIEAETEFIQEVALTEEEWLLNNEMPSSKNLTSVVSGRNFRRFYVDVNNDRVGDLVAIKTSGTGTRSTEVHVLDGKSGFSKFIIQTGTELGEVGSNPNINFLVGTSQRGGIMIYVIQKAQTGTNSTEVHVLSSRRGYKFYSNNGTPLPETDRSYTFRLRVSGHRYLHHIEVFRNGAFVGTLNGFDTFRSFR